MGALKAVANPSGSSGTLVPVPVTGSYGMQASDAGKLIACTTGATDATVTLASAAAAGANAIVYIQKADTGDVPITGAANNGSGLVRLAFAAGPTITTNNFNTALNVTGTTEANGSWLMTSIDSTHADLQGSKFVNTYVSGGVIKGGKVIVTDGVANLAFLFQQGDIVCLISNGATWSVLSHDIQPFTYYYAVAGSPVWTPPPLLTRLYVRLVSGGGGGGSGRRGATSSARSGGTGGNAGLFNDEWLLAETVGTSPITLTVGAGGVGGAAVTVDSTDGNPAMTAGGSSFTGFLSSSAGTAGKAGSSAAVTSPSSQLGSNKYYQPGQGAATSVTGAASTASSGGNGPGCGGAGASLSSGNVDLAGSAGTNQNAPTASTVRGAGGAAGGTGTGAPGGNGTKGSVPFSFGGGGGGGATNGSGVGGAGGNGGPYGGGGGGGSASLNGANSGAGGNGGDGGIDIQMFFD